MCLHRAMSFRPQILAGFAPRLAIFYAAIFIMVGIQLPFFPLWLGAKGLDSRSIGLVLSVPMIVRLVAVPLFTRHADRRDALRGLLAFCAATSVAGYLLVGLADGAAMILGAYALAAIVYTPVMPLAEAYALRGLGRHAYGPVRLWGSAAFIAGTFIAGVAADLIPARHLIWLIVVACVFQAAAGFGLAPLDPAAPHAAEQVRGRKPLLRDPAFLAVLAAAALIQSSHAVYYGFSTLAWSRAGFDGTTIAALWALGVGAEIALFAVSAELPPFVTPSRLLLVGAAGAVVRWSAMAFDPSPALLPWLQMLHALSFGATHLGALAFVSQHAPPGQAASAQGTLSIVLGLAMAAALSLSGLLFAAYGNLGYAAMALAAVAGGGCGCVAYRLGRDAAH